MKRFPVFAAVYTASLALIVVIVAVALFAYAATSDRAMGIALTSSTLPGLLLIMLLLGIFSSWITRRLLRSRAPGVQQNAR